MALNKDVLGPLLKVAAAQYNNVAVDTADSAAMDAYADGFWKALANAIIIHLKTAGVVNVTVITAGTPTNHTGTGSGTIS